MIDLLKLRVFVQVAESGSFSEAAKVLNRAQPTVSHHIKMLETDFGVKLFNRSGLKLTLTDGGRILLPWARKLLRRSGEISEMMGSLKDNIVGELRIACSTTSGKYILPQLAARFKQRFPGISVSILSCTPPHVLLRLLGGDANLGVLSHETVQAGMDIQEFFEDSITLIVPKNHQWANAPHVEPEDIINEPLIIREPTSGTSKVMLGQFAKYDIVLDDLNVFLTLGNAEAIVESVAAGYGVAFVSRLAAACPLQIGKVIEVPVSGFKLKRDIYMVRKLIDVPNHHPQEVFWSFVHDPSNHDLLKMAGIPRTENENKKA